MQEDSHRNNLKTLFGVENIPKETQKREIIDGMESIFSAYFKRVLFALTTRKSLGAIFSFQACIISL
jgi:hypothetical protein